MNNLHKQAEIFFPAAFNWEEFARAMPEEPFSENAVSFLNALSAQLRNNVNANKHPEIITFAFFCRRASLIQLKAKYYSGKIMRKGRGKVFHISPSNTPLNFAYSMVSALLSGNTSIVRLPSEKFVQVDVICEAIKEVSREPQFSRFAQRLLLLRYDKTTPLTSFFSSVCDARIIWGGDATIAEIKKNNRLPDHAMDVTFGDKFSICVINANQYVNEKHPQHIALSFYNDTFFFDQNACTSPHLLVWTGNKSNIQTSRHIFWEELHKLVKKRYNFQSHQGIDKLTAFCTQAIYFEGIKKTDMPDNLIWRVELKELTKDIEKFRCSGGYFAEYIAKSLQEISCIVSSKYQTIASYGISAEDWMQFEQNNMINVTERIRPIGKTSEFSLTWDGCNLIEKLSVPLLGEALTNN